MTERPKRHIEMKLEVGADSREDLAAELEVIARKVRMGYINWPTGASGGVNSDHTYTLTVNEGVTHDSFFEAVDKWLAEFEGEDEQEGEA